MLRAYFDESGDENDLNCHFVAMAGLVASAEGWEKFEPQWRATLEEFGLSHFHMREYAHWSGQFADRASWPEERRRTLMSRLLLAVSLAEPRLLGAVMSLVAWRTFSKSDRALFKAAYYPCMQECVRLSAVLAYMEKAPLAIVFSRQKEFRAQAGPLWAILKKGRFDGVDRLGPFAMEDMLRVPVRVLLAIDPAAFVVNINADLLAQQVEGARRIQGLD